MGKKLHIWDFGCGVVSYIKIYASNGFWNLGRDIVKGTMPVEKCVELIAQKLYQLGLSIKNLVAITTDRASTMTNVGCAVQKSSYNSVSDCDNDISNTDDPDGLSNSTNATGL
jgi:hypothetical protein